MFKIDKCFRKCEFCEYFLEIEKQTKFLKIESHFPILMPDSFTDFKSLVVDCVCFQHICYFKTLPSEYVAIVACNFISLYRSQENKDNCGKTVDNKIFLRIISF